MSGTPPAASTLALSSRLICGGDCGGAASARAAPLLAPFAAFLPPNQPMIYCFGKRRALVRRNAVVVYSFLGRACCCSYAPPAFVYCLNGLVSRRSGAALAPTVSLAQSTARRRPGVLAMAEMRTLIMRPWTRPEPSPGGACA